MRPQDEPQVYLNENSIGGRRSSSNFVVRADCNVDIRKPSWKGQTTVFRPYPMVRRDDPSQFYPYRVDPTGRNYFGHWLIQCHAAWGVGTGGVTFLLCDPYSPEAKTYDPWQSPLGVLWRAIENACKSGQGRPEWQPLREGGPGRGKALTAPSVCFLMQGALLQYDSKPTYGPGRVPPGTGNSSPFVLMASKSTGEKLIQKLAVERDDFRGDPGDFEHRYAEGDPVALEHGRYITLFEAGHDPRDRYLARPTGGLVNPFAAAQPGFATQPGGGQGFEAKGFDLYLSKELEGAPAALSTPEQRQMVLGKVKRWEDILFFPTAVEQAHILARNFPASAILYAYADRPDWIPDDVRERAVAAVTVQPQFAGPFAAPAPFWLPAAGGQLGYHQASPFGAPPAPAYASPASYPSSPAYPPASFPATSASPPTAAPFDAQPAYPAAPAGATFGPSGPPTGFGPAVPLPAGSLGGDPWARVVDKTVPAGIPAGAGGSFPPDAAAEADVAARTAAAVAKLMAARTPPAA